jgi:hypothetical protein
MLSRALQCHPRCCGGTGRLDAAMPAAVRPTVSRQLHPRVSVRTTTQREISTPPPSKPLLGRHRAHHDASSEARFARTAVHSVVLIAMPPHVARIVRHPRKLPPLLPIKGGAVPWPRGEDREHSPARFLPSPRYWHLPQSKPLGPGGPASSPTSLVAPSAGTTVQRNIVPRAHRCWTYGPGRNQDKPSVTSCLAPAIER